MHAVQSALVLAFSLALPTAAAQGGAVWVVSAEGGPGVDFTTIHEAVAAAQSGDRVLVQPGHYGFFVIDGKGIDVVAEAGGAVDVGWGGDGIASKLQVENVPPGESVTLRGLQLLSPPVALSGTLSLRDNAGAVWVEDCGATGAPAVRVRDSASVAFVRCAFQGTATGGEPGTMGPTRPAIESLRSSVWLQGGSAHGAAGYTAFDFVLGTWFGHPGAPAVTAEESLISVMAGELSGGKGGTGIPDPAAGPCLQPPTDGAPAILAVDPASLVHVFGGRIAGGAAGASAFSCPPASAAPDLDGPGTFVLHPGEPLELEAPSAVREGQTLQAVLQGAPGDLAFLGVSHAHEGLLLPALAGALLLDAPLVVHSLGTLPAGGALSFQALVPELGPAVQGLSVYLQGGSCGAGSGGCALGTASATLLLDGAF